MRNKRSLYLFVSFAVLLSVVGAIGLKNRNNSEEEIDKAISDINSSINNDSEKDFNINEVTKLENDLESEDTTSGVDLKSDIDSLYAEINTEVSKNDINSDFIEVEEF